MTRAEISSERFVNEEGSDFVTVTIHWPGTEAEEERHLFASYFDDPGPSAAEQAASFVAALEESEERHAEAERLGVHPLEIAFAPFGPEWQREREEERD